MYVFKVQENDTWILQISRLLFSIAVLECSLLFVSLLWLKYGRAGSTFLTGWTTFYFLFSQSVRRKKGKKKWWYRSAGLTGETVGVGQTEEISSLTPTRVQGGVPGHCSRGYKLIAGVSYWPFKQGVAVLFCKSKMSVSGCSINL